MKRLLSAFLLLSASALVRAQKVPLELQVEGSRFFLKHTVAAKENWYSVGRLYNVSPKEIAPYNNTTMSRGLSIGEVLRIPMGPQNFTQEGGAAAHEMIVPLYHKVREKEGLYRVSQQYNKVSVDLLKAWNKLPGDQISVGTPLIVGFLKVKADQSPLAKLPSARPGDGSLVAQAPAVKAEAPVAVTESSVVKTESATKTEPTGTKQNPPASKSDPAIVKTEPPASKPEARQTAPVQNGGAQSKGGGAFRGLYEEQSRNGAGNSLSGAAAAFKSTSGWKDGKYYVLMNKVPPGTIVLVTNPSNAKFVYAKVLGEIPPMKENEGLLMRISNAAAAELDLGDGRFDLQLSWAKL
jgi:LysM repeat protein